MNSDDSGRRQMPQGGEDSRVKLAHSPPIVRVLVTVVVPAAAAVELVVSADMLSAGGVALRVATTEAVETAVELAARVVVCSGKLGCVVGSNVGRDVGRSVGEGVGGGGGRVGLVVGNGVGRSDG